MKPTSNPNLTELSEEFKLGTAKILQYQTKELSIYSYLLLSKGKAVLIDPVIDTEAYQKELSSSGCALLGILLTHHHSDYISGHLEFGNTPIYMGLCTKISRQAFEAQPLPKQFLVGEVRIEAMHTPGHTAESTCYVVVGPDNNKGFVFTGDCLFAGDVGRPDVAVPTELSKQSSAELLFESLGRLKELSPNCTVLPGHFAGTAYGKTVGNQCSTTIGAELKANSFFKLASKEEFVEKILSEVPIPPSIRFSIASLNILGHRPFRELAQRKVLSVQEWKDLTKKATMIDTRSNNDSLKKGYIKDAYLMPEAGMLSTWLGGMFDPITKFIIFAEKGQAEEVAIRFARIGLAVLGFNGFSMEEWAAEGGAVEIPKFSKIEIMKQTPNAFILDVRTEEQAIRERVVGSHNIPFTRLDKQVQFAITQISAVPLDKPIFIHCRLGLRARVAASILNRHGVPNYILPVKFEEFAEADVPLLKNQPL